MRIIFADGNAAARTLLQQVLDELGHEAAGFDDGESAWEAYRESPHRDRQAPSSTSSSASSPSRALGSPASSAGR